MDEMKGAPAPEQGNPGQQVAEAFPKLLQVMTGLADAVPAELQEEYMGIVQAFEGFVQKFTGGAQEAPAEEPAAPQAPNRQQMAG